MINQNRIKELVKKYTEDMRCARRRLHEYPEISNEEERTAAYMAKTLRSFGAKGGARVLSTGFGLPAFLCARLRESRRFSFPVGRSERLCTR